MKKVFGNNAVVGQSGGPTAAINATLSGVIAAELETMAKNGGTQYFECCCTLVTRCVCVGGDRGSHTRQFYGTRFEDLRARD